MAKAEIIEDKGGGLYTIKRLYAGRDVAETKIRLLNNKIAELQETYSEMPESTEDEIFDKHIVQLQITSLQTQVRYITEKFPEDIIVDAYCADHTEGLSGEVGTIDIPGEVTELVNIRPGYDATAAFVLERDGQFYPSIAVGPWTSFVNQCILPGWQKWYPKYRYGRIVAGTIDHTNSTCSVTIDPSISSQQNLDVNQGDGFGAEIVEDEREVYSFYQPAVPAYPAYQDFCDRYPSHPIVVNNEFGGPIEISDLQYSAVQDVQVEINTSFEYESDQSGYGIGEYFNIMYDPATDKGDCEDFALTKMDRIIQRGILPAKNIQLIFCEVISGIQGALAEELGLFFGHAVAGIQTLNKGFLILDNRYYSVTRKSLLSQEYAWSGFVFAGKTVVTTQRLKGQVPIEYMRCNSTAFQDEDEVIVEFTGQDWTQPKVIGFKEEPGLCGVWSMFGGPPWEITAYSYTPSTDSWVAKADATQYLSGLYYFEVPFGPWAGVGVYPIVVRHSPMATLAHGSIYSFGGWFNNGEYMEDRRPSAYAIDTCERFDITLGTWSRINKDEYIGRSCGAAWAIGNQHYIACGAKYDERNNTFFPHIDLESNYVRGEWETCVIYPLSRAYDYEYRREWPEFFQKSDWMYSAPQLERDGGFDEDGSPIGNIIVGPCRGGISAPGDMVCAHSFPPSDPDIPYTFHVKENFSYYRWINASPEWGKYFYSNYLFGECLRYSDDTDTYAQQQATAETMMVGSFVLDDIGYVVGGTHEEVSEIIRSANVDGMTDDSRKYDAISNSWSLVKSFPEDRLHAAGLTMNGKGYIFSGYSKTNHSGSYEQLFGHEWFELSGSHVHPESYWFAGRAPEVTGIYWCPPLGILPGEIISLFCTNTMHEFDKDTDTWTQKNNASTPRGNCKYREWYNWYGSVERGFYYTVTEGNCLVNIYYDERYGGDSREAEISGFHELQNPGPTDDDYGLLRKKQHIYKYPATGGSLVGYIMSEDYAAEYNPLTDSYTVKNTGEKDHLSGAMV